MSIKKTNLFIFILLIGIVSWFIFITMRYPYMDFNVIERNGHWYVSQMDPRSLITKTDLQINDEILFINKNKVEDYYSVRRWGAVDQAKEISVKRGDLIFKIQTDQLSKLTKEDLLSVFGGLSCLFVSLLLLLGIKNSESAKRLAIVFVSISLTFLSLGASIRGDLLGKMIIGAGLVTIPIAMVHFLIVFLNDKGQIKLETKNLKWWYASVIFFTLPLLFRFDNLSVNQWIHKIYSLCELLFFSIGALINIVYLIFIYLKHCKSNPYLSMIIKTIIVFFSISITPIVCFSFFTKIMFGFEWIRSGYSGWFILLFPLSFTYLMVTKKIYDIDLIVRRIILTTAVSIIPSAIIVLMIPLIYSYKMELNHMFLAFTVLIVLISVTLYSLEYFTNKLEKTIFPRRYYLQSSIKKIAKKLGLISSFTELKELVLKDIIEILQVYGGAIFFKYNDSHELISEGAILERDILSIFSQKSVDSDLVVFELTRNQEYVSYLVLTRKKTNTYLGSEEMQWLNLITSYLSISMENLYLIRKMSHKLELLAAQVPSEETANDIAWFRKLMFELQEKERFRIATDLHDTTMQDLFFLKRKLAALLDNYSDDWQDSEQAKSLLDYIDIINMNLRQSCFELHPYLLQELGLVRTIDKLIDLEQSTLPFEVEFRYGGIDLIESCNMEMKRHLFRVFQELINNAKKHSNATKVNFNLSASNGKLVMQYRDNGLGFLSEQDLVREIGGSHIGLEQLKSRILSMRGVFEIKSGQGSGMSFSAVIPLKEGMTA
ncbi:sensor histidine kinase [Cohnella hashimotonis]|uniref:histidine kinase n=1 Tax=Cohnella hashimotonis TaxID=2826895 RepID=A0ABT6TGA3_9BACL|nr:ATP-binding protein [Cohnella hashimotonis]MDI4645740.1 histidine kinase [Cohnella hashimotonis]